MGVVASVEGLPTSRQGIAGRALSVLLAVTLAATMTVLPTRPAEAATSTVKVPATYGQTEARTQLAMINEFRASGAKCWNADNSAEVVYPAKAPLEYDYALEQAAMLRAAEIAVSFDHQRPNGMMCFTAGYDRPLVSYVYGENIAVGYNSAYSVYMGWREDNEKYEGQGHRRNMLEDFTSIGIGYVKCNGIGFWVQNFSWSPTGAAATAADNSTRAVEVEVEDSLVTSKSMSLSSSATTLVVGETASLPTATVQMAIMTNWPSRSFRPDTSDVVWTSANPAVAAIENGSIVAKAAGSAQLTASLYGTSATMQVTVTDVPPASQPAAGSGASAAKPGATAGAGTAKPGASNGGSTLTAAKKLKAPTLKSAKLTGKKKIVVKWKKPAKNVKSYQIVCSTSKKFTKKTTVTKPVSKGKTSVTIKKLKSAKKYYVKIRASYKVGNKTKWSNWSKVKVVKAK